MVNDFTLTVADQLADTLRSIRSNLTGRDNFNERVKASLNECQEALDYHAGKGKWVELMAEDRAAYEIWYGKLLLYLRFRYGDAVARYHDTSSAQRWYELGYTPEGAGDKLIAE